MREILKEHRKCRKTPNADESDFQLLIKKSRMFSSKLYGNGGGWGKGGSITSVFGVTYVTQLIK